MRNQNRHYRDVAGQRGFQLDPDEIFGVFQSSLTRAIPRIDPAWTDDGQDRRAVADDLVEVAAKILSQRDGIHVLEDTGFAELVYQAVVDPTGGVGIIAAAITDEDARTAGTASWWIGRRQSSKSVSSGALFTV